MAIPRFIYSFTSWRTLRLFPVWGPNKQGCLQCCIKSLCGLMFISLGQIPGSRITSSYDTFLYTFLRNCQMVFHSGCIILCSHQQSLRVPVSPHLHQHLLLFALLIITILVDVCKHLLLGLGVGGWREQKVPTELRKYLETEKWGSKLHMSNGSVCDRVIYPQGGVQQMMIWKHLQLYSDL